MGGAMKTLATDTPVFFTNHDFQPNIQEGTP
jgi:hypothetical protein